MSYSLTSCFVLFFSSGWLLCPIPEVFEDAKRNWKGEHRAASMRILEKLYHGSGADMSHVKDKFWMEVLQFHNKHGDFNEGYIWNAEALREGKSYVWHEAYSSRSTDVLGKVAMRVTSKMLGIGAAERCWGAVKHLKTNKRSHLSADATKKQATLFSVASIEASRRKLSLKEAPDHLSVLWNDDDLEHNIGLEDWGDPEEESNKPPVRVLKAWMEDWEKASVTKKKDVVARQKFLTKYGGLRVYDADHNVYLSLSEDDIKYAHKIGWCIMATDPDGEQEPLAIFAVQQCIEDTHDWPDYIQVVRKGNNDDDDDGDGEDDEEDDNEASAAMQRILQSQKKRRQRAN